MKRQVLLLMLTVLPVAAQAPRTQVFTGVITETMCKRNHSMMGQINSDAQCIIDCVKASKSVKYALHDGKNMYLLSDQATPEKFAAQKVRVKGALYTKTGIIKVESIEAVR